jgi:uncharacterized protein YjeT (DUF2065 family)
VSGQTRSVGRGFGTGLLVVGWPPSARLLVAEMEKGPEAPLRVALNKAVLVGAGKAAEKA